jgi:hypothetical protein
MSKFCVRRPFLLYILGLTLLLFAGSAALAATTGCPQSGLSHKASPLAGAWVLHSYKEIHGHKAYAEPGDYILVQPTDVPGQACVEFTRFVEGSYFYYVAIDSSGSAIDDNITTDQGHNLRILIQRAGDGISMVLYTTVTSASAQYLEGGEEQGGGAGGGSRP